MIDFDRYSLRALLKMARDIELIDGYEYNRETALIVVGETRHSLTHPTARSFLQGILTEWWQRQEQFHDPHGEITA